MFPDKDDSRTPEQIVYQAGRNVAALYPEIVPLIRVFQFRPDPCLVEWEIFAWGELPDAVALEWFLRGCDSPAPSLIGLDRRTDGEAADNGR